MATLNLRQTSFGNWCVLVAVLATAFYSSLSPAAEPDYPVDQPQQEMRNEGNQPRNRPVELDAGYFKGYWLDTKDMLAAPRGWDRADWMQVSVIATVSAGLFTQDEKIKSWVQTHKNRTSSRVADDVSTMYNLSLPALAGFGLYGLAAGDPTAKETFLLGAESVVITAAFVQTLKRSFGRHRPYTGDSHDTWSGPVLFDHGEDLSFPSGDASTAFAIASVVAAEYDNAVVPPVVYTMSSLVALERVHNNAHWSSDVFVGSVIGYFTGKAVVRSHAAGKGNNLSVAPLMIGKSPGVVVTLRY